MLIAFHAPRLDLDKIAASGQCFRWTPAPLGGYLVPTAGQCAAIYRLGNEIHVLDYTLPGGTPFSPEGVAARDQWGHYLGIYEPPEWWDDLDLWAKREPDAYLTRAARAADGLRLLNQAPFETLISFIISQNNNIPRIKGTIEALCRRFGRRHYIPNARGNFPGAEWWDFPEPETLTDDRALQGLGLGYRDAYVANAARAVAEGRFELDKLSCLPYDAARARLKTLPGVGDKVANCICLFALGYKDAFPIDVHIRRVLEREFPNGFPFERFPGYAGFVQQLIFYYERESTKRKEIAIP